MRDKQPLVLTLWAPLKGISELSTFPIDSLSCDKNASLIHKINCENVDACPLNAFFDHNIGCRDRVKMELCQHSTGHGDYLEELSN